MRRALGAVLIPATLAVVGCSGSSGPADVTLTSIDLSPASATLQVGTTQAFAATGHYSDGTTASVAVDWTATGGTVSSAGLYTAGSVAGSYQVVATEQGGSISKAAGVTLTAAPPVLTSVTVAPSTISLAPAGTQQFTATGHYTGGGTGSVTVTWTATGGTISATGLYTAGAVDGTYQVTATATGNALAGHADVTVATPPPNLVSIEVAPARGAGEAILPRCSMWRLVTQRWRHCARSSQLGDDLPGTAGQNSQNSISAQGSLLPVIRFGAFR